MGLVGCWSFTSLQRLRLYLDGHWLVMVCTHGVLIVLPHWEIRLLETMTWYPAQSHYPDTELTSHCPILLMSSTRLGSDKYPFYNSLFLLDLELNYRSATHEARALPIRPPHLVLHKWQNAANRRDCWIQVLLLLHAGLELDKSYIPTPSKWLYDMTHAHPRRSQLNLHCPWIVKYFKPKQSSRKDFTYLV